MSNNQAQEKSLNIQFLLTGTELMVGDIVDTNSVVLAQSLKEHGVELARKVTLGDDFDCLVAEIHHISQQADVLIINGGLGPTEDDLTAAALAKVIVQPLEENNEALSHLEAWCEKRGFRLEGANRKQVLLPKGVDIIPNRIGSAVGFSIEHNDCLIMCTPGVPSELKVMWQDEVLHVLKPKLPSLDKVKTLKMHVFGIGESAIQNFFNNQLTDWPQEIEVGYRAAPPFVEVKLTTRNLAAEKRLPTWKKKITDLLAGHVISMDVTQSRETVSIEKNLVDLLRDYKQTITTAESCTGGLIAANLTRVAGSSSVFEAGYVTYSDRIKSELLQVKETTLMAHGAVSEPVVIEMAKGALKASHSDWVIAVSGIAGPGGGSEEKPVGTVWICWGRLDNLKTKCLVYPANRIQFQRFIANVGLDLIRREILDIKDEPSYFSRTGK